MSDFLQQCVKQPPEYGDADFYERLKQLKDIGKQAYEKGDMQVSRLVQELVCHCSCEEFTRTYLRHKMTVFKRREKKNFYYEPAPFHKKIYWDLECSDKREEYCMINVPRHHGKTTCMEMYVLWKILTGRSHFVVLICESQGMAMDRLASIKESLLSPTIKEKWGNFGKTKMSDVWTQKKIELDFSYGGIEHHVTIQAFGESQNLKGLKTAQDQRPDLVLMDDVFAHEDLLASRDRKDRAHSWVMHSIVPLGDEAQLLNIGTIGVYDDPQIRLSSGGGWETIRYAACNYNGRYHIPLPKNPEDPPSKWDFSEDEGEMLWDRYSKKWLYKKYLHFKEQGKISEFYLNYCNIIQDEKENVFPRTNADGEEKMIYYSEEPKTLVADRRLQIYMTIDPASSIKATADNRVCMIVGVDRKTDIWYVLDFYAGKDRPEDFMKIIINKIKEWNPLSIGVEKHGAQIYFANNLESFARENFIYKEWVELKPGNQKDAKHIRIAEVLSGRYVQGKLLFRRNHDKVLDEAWSFVKFVDSGHDDCLDALAYMGQLIPSPRRTSTKPYTRTCTYSLPK